MSYIGYVNCVNVCVSMQTLSNDLTRSPDSLENLKFVLSVIARIRAMSLDVEILYRFVHVGFLLVLDE